MSSTAAERFASIPELLREMGDQVFKLPTICPDDKPLTYCPNLQILNRKLLYNLCLVSRTFNIGFTPALYAELEINLGTKYVIRGIP